MDHLDVIKSEIGSADLVAISKTQPNEVIMEFYDAGLREFGENKVQDLREKEESLPKDIKWHFVGHLQSNKVKYLAPFVHLVHSLDSMKLAQEIQKQGARFERTISCLVQVHIAEEESKFGVPLESLDRFLSDIDEMGFQNLEVSGLMGMATLTSDQDKNRKEFESLHQAFLVQKKKKFKGKINMNHLSMGMSGDYKLALECGSNMVRIGTGIFGPRRI